MGVATDKTIKELKSAVNGIDTSNLLSDSTGVAIKNAILAIANAITTNNSLVGLNDVDITSPTDGQVLLYNATSQKWENGNASGGGSYSETVLWTGSQSTSRWVNPIELSIDLTNYKFINVKSTNSCHLILVSAIPSGDSGGADSISTGSFTDQEYMLWFNKDTNILRIFTSTGTNITINEIIGISF